MSAPGLNLCAEHPSLYSDTVSAIRTPDGVDAREVIKIAYASYRELGGKAWVVMAQFHSGGRGAASGVKICCTPDEVHACAGTLFGKHMVTKQTDANGKGVYRVRVKGASDMAKEMYLGCVLDRKSERIMIVASAHGGLEIEGHL